MGKPSVDFRAGWQATTEHMDGVAAYGEHDFERHLQAAWDEYQRSQSTAPKSKEDELVDDWNDMVATVAAFSEKHNLPKAELIFDPRVLYKLRSVSDVHILGTLIHMGVKARFGKFELGTILRES